MRRTVVALVVVGLLIAPFVFAQEKPTRLYTPVTKQATYSAIQTGTTIWTPTTYESIVWDSFVVSTPMADQKVTFAASDTIVVVNVAASQPVISPGNWLWKKTGETIRVTTTGANVDITLGGWEESN